MEVALFGDSVFDNRSYVNSDLEAVESVLRNSGIACKLYAVDGSIIASVYSQIKELKPNLAKINNIFLSVGGNNAFNSLHLVSKNIYISSRKGTF